MFKRLNAQTLKHPYNQTKEAKDDFEKEVKEGKLREMIEYKALPD